MNAGRSIKVALAKKDMAQKDLAKKMGVSTAYISQLAGREHIGMGTIGLLAEAFNMRVSEFVALGEE